MRNNNSNIEALDNKLSVLLGRKKRMSDYQVEYPENSNIKNELDAINLSIAETEQELKDELEAVNK